MQRILNENGISSEEAQRKIIRTAEIIYENAMQHFKDLQISPFNPKHTYTGNLKRRIHWKIFNAAGGNEVVLRFYTENITSFVEMATQRGAHATMVAPVKGKRYEGPTRSDDTGKPMERRAKPFLANEIRLHMRILHNLLMKEYAYMGHAMMVYGLTPKHPAYVDPKTRQKAFGVRWEIDEMRTFGYKLVGESK